MAEPVISTSIVSTTITGAGIIILGFHTGLDYPTVIAGVAGGATALSGLDPAKPWKRAFEVITAALFAGYASPPVSSVVINLLGKWSLVDQKMSAQSIELIVAFLMGYMAHGVVLPGLRRIGKKRLGGYSE